MLQRPHRLQQSGQKAMIHKEVLIGVCLCMPEGIAHAILELIMDVMIHWHIHCFSLGGKLAGISLCRTMMILPFMVLLPLPVIICPAWGQALVRDQQVPTEALFFHI